jgi:hypothetical protein
MKCSTQISPDDWVVYQRTMICTDNTTIGQIKEWAKGEELHVSLDEADLEKE